MRLGHEATLGAARWASGGTGHQQGAGPNAERGGQCTERFPVGPDRRITVEHLYRELGHSQCGHCRVGQVRAGPDLWKGPQQGQPAHVAH